MTGELPSGLELVRTTETFDETHHPAGLRRSHRVADGVWARLVVHEGELGFVFEDDAAAVRLASGGSIVIPPARLHHVVIDGRVRFAIEFHRSPSVPDPAPGPESTGLTGD